MLGGYLLDDVEFAFPRGALGSYPGTGPIPGSDLPIVAGDDVALFGDLRIAQPLTQLPRIRMAARAAETGREVASAELAAARLSLAAAVRDLYFGLLETRASLAAGESATLRLRELVRRTEVAAGEQVVLEADLLESRLALATREHQQRQLANAEAARREELLRLLGRPLDSSLELAELPPPALYEGELAGRPRGGDLPAAGASGRPPARRAGRAGGQGGGGRALARAEPRPPIHHALPDRPVARPHRLAGSPALLGALGLGQEAPPDRRPGSRRPAARAALADAEQQVATEVGRAFRRLGEARAGIELAELGVAVAKERARVAQARFDQQAAQVLDLLQAESSLAEAEARATAARLELWSAHGAFRRTLAEDLP